MRALAGSLHQALLKGQILCTVTFLLLLRLSNKGCNLSRFLMLFVVKAAATCRRVIMLRGRRRLHRKPSRVARHHHSLICPVARRMVMMVISRTMLP